MERNPHIFESILMMLFFPFILIWKVIYFFWKLIIDALAGLRAHLVKALSYILFIVLISLIIKLIAK